MSMQLGQDIVDFDRNRRARSCPSDIDRSLPRHTHRRSPITMHRAAAQARNKTRSPDQPTETPGPAPCTATRRPTNPQPQKASEHPKQAPPCDGRSLRVERVEGLGAKCVRATTPTLPSERMPMMCRDWMNTDSAGERHIMRRQCWRCWRQSGQAYVEQMLAWKSSDNLSATAPTAGRWCRLFGRAQRRRGSRLTPRKEVGKGKPKVEAGIHKVGDAATKEVTRPTARNMRGNRLGRRLSGPILFDGHLFLSGASPWKHANGQGIASIYNET